MPDVVEVTPPSLAERVHEALPWAYVVRHRVLRRVVRMAAENRGRSIGTYRLDSFSIPAEEFWQAVDPVELGLDQRPRGEGHVTLVRETDNGWFRAPTESEEVLRTARALFRERVKVELGSRPVREAIERADRIGRDEYADCVSVLVDEGRVRHADDPWSCYADFAATLLELRRFDPGAVSVWFPVLEDVDAVVALIDEDVDAERVADESRVPGFPDSAVDFDSAPREGRSVLSERRASRAARRARRLAGGGNWGRAVLVEDNAVGTAEGPSRDVAREFAEVLARDVDPETDWWDVVVTLARSGPTGGFWAPVARLLYDLQRAANDAGRTAYSVRLLDWIWSFGRRPIRRPVPLWSHTRVLRHLRRGRARLLACDLDPDDLHRLKSHLDEAIRHRERRLGDACRPQVVAALEQAGLEPTDPVHRAARGRVVEEYLDVVVARGFASLSVLRDVLARNDLKLPDLAGVGEALTADPLLRIDRELDQRLLGLHRRGEFYLRWLQTLGGLAFGTTFGRRVLMHVVIPFGGALLLLEGLQHLAIEPLALLFRDLHHVHLANPFTIVGVGAVAHVLIHAPRLRRRIGRALGRWFSGVIRLPWTIGQWLRRIPIVVRRVGWWLLRPVLVLLAAGAVLQAMELDPILPWPTLTIVYLCTFLIVNSRPVRVFEEVLVQELSESWQGLWHGIVQFGRLVLEFFRAVVDAIERVLYATDESLRSREGEGRVTAALRLVVGPLWSAVAYVVRFVVNLLVEPQVNPLKHFPVVTVSHKLLLPTIPAFARVLETAGYDTAAAYTTAGGIVAVIPGAFGFLVWELMGNWRLYEANRSRTLGPARIGGHGETMAGLLRRGLHSGTLPRSRARLRRATARDEQRAVEWAEHHVHDVAECVERFVERQFVALLTDDDSGTSPDPTDGTGERPDGYGDVHVRCGTRRLEITVSPPTSVHVTISEREGRLVARVDPPQPDESPDDARVRMALVGLFFSFGVDLVEAQLDVLYPPEEFDVEPRSGGIVVRRRPGMESACLVKPEGGSPIVPRRLAGTERWPAVPEADVLFSAREVTWDDWVAAWVEPGSLTLVPDFRVVPESVPETRTTPGPGGEDRTS